MYHIHVHNKRKQRQLTNYTLQVGNKFDSSRNYVN